MLPINKREGKREIISSFVRGMWPLGIGRCRSSKFCMDTSLLFMGRWLKGFGVRIISYVVILASRLLFINSLINKYRNRHWLKILASLCWS
ncbi:hypothetical protein GLYMA_18G095850v4 [Glycine max]|nr:hypothetical protein GLYMA_18G095850v4 [Glycine max]